MPWLDGGMATTPGDTTPAPAPARRSNVGVYIVGVILVLVVGALIAGGILLVTGRAKTPKLEGLIRFGQAASIRDKAKDGGPFAYAGSSGDTGFWVALEDGKLVALKIRKPGTKDCNVIWRGSRDTFVDCNGNPIRMSQLARYPVKIPETGKNKGQFLVDLSGNIPPPAGS
jgi:hypothetical protein